MKKILVVDDQQMYLNMVSFKLEKAGFTPVTAKNGEEAIRLFESDPPLLVITDLRMPVKNGFDFIQFMRNDLNSHIPVLVLSVETRDESKVKAIRLGANDYMDKPFKPSELVNRVNRLISLSNNLMAV